MSDAGQDASAPTLILSEHEGYNDPIVFRTLVASEEESKWRGKFEELVSELKGRQKLVFRIRYSARITIDAPELDGQAREAELRRRLVPLRVRIQDTYDTGSLPRVVGKDEHAEIEFTTKSYNSLEALDRTIRKIEQKAKEVQEVTSPRGQASR